MDQTIKMQPKYKVSIGLVLTAISFCLVFTISSITWENFGKSNINYNFADAQLIPTEYPFENATHIQYNPGDQVYPKPSARLTLDLIRNPEGISFSGDAYSPVYTSVVYDINDNGKMKTYLLDLTSSGTNDVSISDTKIYPSFSFRVPMGTNSTVEKVNEISQFIDVDNIATLPDVTTYTGYNTLPIIINGTSYSNLLTIFDQFKNDTARLYIAAFDNTMNG